MENKMENAFFYDRIQQQRAMDNRAENVFCLFVFKTKYNNKRSHGKQSVFLLLLLLLLFFKDRIQQEGQGKQIIKRVF